ncbi:RNA polymerase sigma factor [Patescibacteria group bacterium]|nr:RNA polymerase sigma factor [Patescibacteria group bacterium]
MEYIDEIRELISKSAQGNSDCFQQLYELLIDKVFAYVRYRTNSEDDALDITQEVFVDIYKGLPGFTYTSKEQFYGFVFTITKRKLAKYYADKHTHATKTTTEFNEDNYSDSLLNPETERDVARALTTLDETAREIVVLHHWSRYSFPEIAALIQMTESAVRVRHHRALKLLSASLHS